MRKTRGRKRRGDAALRPSVWPGRMQVQLRIPRMLRLLRAALSCGDRGDAGRSCHPPPSGSHFPLIYFCCCSVWGSSSSSLGLEVAGLWGLSEVW